MCLSSYAWIIKDNRFAVIILLRLSNVGASSYDRFLSAINGNRWNEQPFNKMDANLTGRNNATNNKTNVTRNYVLSIRIHKTACVHKVYLCTKVDYVLT